MRAEQAAAMMDAVGNKEARQQIAMIKVAAPRMALEVIDRYRAHLGALGTPLRSTISRAQRHPGARRHGR
jgi:acyl-CoA dehydrogenase